MLARRSDGTHTTSHMHGERGHCWECVACAQHTVLAITPTPPPALWIELWHEVVVRQAAGGTARHLLGGTPLGVGGGRPPNVPRRREVWQQDTPPICAHPWGGTLHQCLGGRGNQGGAAGGSHLDAAAPVRLPFPSTVLGPLLARSNRPTRVVAGRAAVPAGVHYEHKWGPKLPAGPGPARGMVH